VITLIARQVIGPFSRVLSEPMPIDLTLTVTATVKPLDGHPYTIAPRMSLPVSHDGEVWWEVAGQPAGYATDQDHTAVWPLREHARFSARAPLTTFDRQGRATPKRIEHQGHTPPVWTPRFFRVAFHHHDAAVEVSASAD
jgi:hypothetical protein